MPRPAAAADSPARRRRGRLRGGVLEGRSRLTDLAVPEGKRVCATVTDGRSMDVTWHAEATTETYRKAIDLALSSAG